MSRRSRSAFDLDQPFFLPMWRRVLVVAACTLWALAEWASAEPFWALIASAFAVYSAWGLLLNFDAAKAEARREEDRRGR